MEPQLNQEVIKTAAAHDGPIETDAVIVGAGPVGRVLALMLAERAARGRGQFHHTTGRYRSIPFTDLTGWRGAGVRTARFLHFRASDPAEGVRYDRLPIAERPFKKGNSRHALERRTTQ